MPSLSGRLHLLTSLSKISMAWYSGMQLWKCFQGLDSTRYPMRNYGDLAFRVFGNWARLGVNVLQSFQFFLNVTLLIVSNGQGLVQMAAGENQKGFLCFMLAEAIFMLAGFLLGQIRTLQRLGFLANLAVWLNLVAIFMTMIVTSNHPPNYAAVSCSSQSSLLDSNTRGISTPLLCEY